jgi:hypothetical protein
MQAIAAGLRSLGAEVLVLADPTIDAARETVRREGIRVAYTCGLRSREAGARGVLGALMIPLLVADLGYFHRATGPLDSAGYNQLGLNRLAWTPPQDCDPSRAAALHIEVCPARPARYGQRLTALILGQVPYDTQHFLDVETLVAWLTERAGFYLAMGYRVLYRPHPLAPTVLPFAPVEIRQPAEHTLAEDFASCDFVVTYNSTAGLEALIAGLPVFCAPCAHYATLAAYDGFRVTRAQVQAYVNRLAWAQWTCAELADGSALRFINQWGRFIPEADLQEVAA